MTDINIIFSRHLLTEMRKELRKYFPHLSIMRNASVVEMTSGGTNCQWHWEGPECSNWQGSADNAYEARYKGWSAYLSPKGIPGWGRHCEGLPPA